MTGDLTTVAFACPDCDKNIVVMVGSMSETYVDTAVMNSEEHIECSNAFESL